MILIGLGTNLGERENNLITAKKRLVERTASTIIRESTIEETRAIVPEKAPASWDTPFLNQIIAILCPAPPLVLLHHIKYIEQIMGRDSSEKWAPRIIDLDILWFHGVHYSHPELTIPHPEIKNRPFITDAIESVCPEILDKIYAHHL
jgi:2-amino-4-hydroxy-6-hydroxymethyldihydropteridine diphosphokinase/dihydropteroate synthase